MDVDFSSNSAPESPRLIVGIDFGTTFSGVAWAQTSSDRQMAITSWPSMTDTHDETSSEKVPTELRYTPERTEWGFQIPARVQRHQWFKLAFAESNIEGMIQSPDAEQHTTDYLKELYKHLMHTLEQEIGLIHLRNLPMEFCLTVPAIWSETSKQKTLMACQDAGMKSAKEILLVSEPEAAAIYTLHGLDQQGLSIGDTFVLCDAGGGTVDLIAYTVTALRPVLKVAEAAVGTGGFCGSSFLNRRFQDFLTAKLGHISKWDDKILAAAMEVFETVIKRQYMPTTAAQNPVSVPVWGLDDDRNLGIRRARFVIESADLNAVFEPVVLSIVQLIQAQIEECRGDVTAILLVGGFGQNIYLKSRIEAAVDPIKVLQPANGWTAVVRGAVMMGLTRSDSALTTVGIVSRAARKHYGLELEVRFNASKHLESKRYFSRKDQAFVVNEMQWFIRRGEAVKEDKPHTINFVAEYLVANGHPNSLSMNILCDPHSRQAPIHKIGSVQTLVSLEADLLPLSTATLSRTMVIQADGQQYYRIAGSIEAMFLSASTKYTLLCQGKRYDSVTAEYA
ncbi:related to hsp70 protein [Rhynchosporium secalis]|uniref:Related to hsp70 protein n=1 Tax=Rhynchosporium secalis TaxID=38038 RepID=A0A1E1MDN1_RHYSE|nr:related to hsp70 protein [Rhynchosporium secalis]